MEDTLKQLQEYQLEALRKGIAYSLYVNDEKIPDIIVKMSYSVTDPIVDCRTFQATFSNEVDDQITKMRMGSIKKFINDIEK